VCSLLLVICFALPRFGGPNHLWMNGLYEAICIIAVFPVIVAMGAGNLKATAASNRRCRTLGDISYPLYLTHYPLSTSTQPGLRKVRIAPVSALDGAFFSGLQPWRLGTPASNSMMNPFARG
jgi:peptidoglycan/LPS O-acetylase OafA/YrhL